jgi:hypothetical protein
MLPWVADDRPDVPASWPMKMMLAEPSAVAHAASLLASNPVAVLPLPSAVASLAAATAISSEWSELFE